MIKIIKRYNIKAVNQFHAHSLIYIIFNLPVNPLQIVNHPYWLLAFIAGSDRYSKSRVIITELLPAPEGTKYPLKSKTHDVYACITRDRMKRCIVKPYQEKERGEREKEREGRKKERE